MLEDATVMAVIPVHDLGKARTFYEKMLGLRLYEPAGSENEPVYSLGNTQLMVYETTAELGGATKAVITVKDLDKEMTNLRNHGIKFEDLDMPNIKTIDGVAEDVHGRVAWFKDVEGNWLALTQLKS